MKDVKADSDAFQNNETEATPFKAKYPMKYMSVKKKILIAFLVVAGIMLLPFLFRGIQWLFVPLSRSDEFVTNYVLKEIPLGTSLDDATEIINDNGWKIRQYSDDKGIAFGKNSGMTYFAGIAEDSDGWEIIGKKAVLVYIGDYHSPFHTAVMAYLAFDENDELIAVRIRRDTDTL